MAADRSHVDVVLVRPRQPGNVGMAARAVANHGLGRLVLVDPPAFDPDEARWMAPGATEVVDRAIFTATVDDAVADRALVVGTTARPRRWRWPVWSPRELVDALSQGPWAGAPTALLFGPEDTGLSNADMARCAAAVRLPTAGYASLNLAQAVTVLTAHLQGLPPPAEAPAAAPVALQGRAVESALGLLELAGYLAGNSAEQVEGTLFRLLGRACPDEVELSAVLGMLAALRWKLEHPER